METSELLYQQTGRNLVQLIENGTLLPGQRVPSVRRWSVQQGVSVGTVLQAYRALEDEGWIEARPQSGYYVRRLLPSHVDESPHATLPPEPGIAPCRNEAVPVSLHSITLQALAASNRADVIQLGTAVAGPDCLPTQKLNKILVQLIRRSPEAAGAYQFRPGNEALRVQIARRMIEAGCSLGPDDIVVTVGCQEALNLCLRAVASPGDTVAIESPTYYGSLQIIEALGLKALEIPTSPRDGVSLDSLQYALETQRISACLFSPNFSNPLGSCMSVENKKRLVEMLAEREIPLIEDDTYGELYFGDTRPPCAKSFDKKGLVLLCSSFSKTAAPGYRIGWVAAGRWSTDVEHLKMTNTLATASLPALAIAEFLSNGGYDHYLRRIRRAYSENVAWTVRTICQHFPSCSKVTRPSGGHVLWVELENTDALKLFHEALAEGISIAPGPMFSARGKYRNCIRLNCGFRPSDELEHALRRVGELAAQLVEE
jgi:DNA-binding transcriptional MocR family regulator